ncbi:family 43 glycosylhydrolase [Paenibacillus cellulositrophicus]|uniref:family 43 glycosylhydrolase n=1 Tax=Paenibacillus cellulositrophicus TaxID=562959 RepID=UPI001FCAB872|nr:family 43 glycosylhydrolase [Paenibacillus cellulositrophicus]
MKSLRWLIMVAVTFSLITTVPTETSAYQNPRTLPDEWGQYGLGDPYVLKFNGYYYLYVSTRDTDDGVKVWSSKDLVNWSYRGLAATDPITHGAYAPEVVYWNGMFYMYTSPAGQGHYVLSSTSPTGPFNVVTGNLGKTIDGHVFIDDDGSFSFYHAGQGRIDAAPMSSPTSIGASSSTGVGMGGWTEGATVFKRNGKYYMTYTGNHVFSKGYRVDYAVSTTGPRSGYVADSLNPALISTEGPTVGLGHNTVVVGPNLDTHYIVYHNLEGPGVVGPLRHLNMDRIVWNNDKLIVQGPTTTPQQDPAMPTFYDYFDRTSIGSGWTNVNGGHWGIYNQELMWQDSIGDTTWYKQISSATSSSDYTAEFNTKEMKRGTSASPRYGATFSYTDENNYGVALLSSKNNRLATSFRINGVDQAWQTFDLPAGFDYTKWHSIRIEKSGTTFKYYVDGMLKGTRTANLVGGKIGVLTEDTHADFGYVAVSNDVNGSSAWDAYKPVPGTIEAVHYMKGGEGVAYHDTTANNIGGAYRTDAGDIRLNSEGLFNLGWNQTGEWYKYKVNVESSGYYDIDFRMATTMNGVQIRLWDGSTDVTGIIDVPNTGDWDNWQTVTKKGVYLNAGQRELRVEFVKGEADFSRMTFHKSAQVTALSDDFNDGNDNGWTRFEGTWAVENGEYSAGSSGPAKSTIGDANWADYTVEADVKMIDAGGDGGLLFRVSNPSHGTERGQNNYDAFQGYYAYLTTSGVNLGKMSYSWTFIQSAPQTYATNTWYHMKVVAKGTNIKVYVDDMNQPKIDYTDNSLNPFTHGKAGVRTANKHTHFDNFKVSP